MDQFQMKMNHQEDPPKKKEKKEEKKQAKNKRPVEIHMAPRSPIARHPNPAINAPASDAKRMIDSISP